jgi:predicted NUDIX family phosphoesterase
MENILVIKREFLPDEFVNYEVAHPLSFYDFAKYCAGKTEWVLRDKAENNTAYKQIIPYAIVNFNDKIALYQRKGTEKRLENLYSIGIGGHINEHDNGEDFNQTIEKGLFRELSEEFKNFTKIYSQINFLGLINEEKTEVGKVHIGAVFLVKSDIELQPDYELNNFQWIDEKELKNFKLEYWSMLAYKLLKLIQPVNKSATNIVK